jgi:transposase
MKAEASSTTLGELRYLGVDLHKHYVVVGGVNAQQTVVLPPRRVELDDWSVWAKQHLRPSDVLVVEATGNTWMFYAETIALVLRIEVANAGKLPWIGQARVKTDKQDVMKLARLCAAGLIPQVWVPPVHVRELRLLFSHRRRLVKVSTLVKNRLQSLLHRHHLAPPKGEVFSQANRGWWQQLDRISLTERLHVKHDLATLKQVEEQLAEIEAELNRLSTTEPWAAAMPYLMQLPGLGLIGTLTVLAAIGDITRFESAKKLVGYAGLGASVHDSGLTHRTGRITKSGRRDLRHVLVEAAWAAVEHHPFWKAEFARLARRMAENKAVVAIARRLLVAIWHVLAERAADKHAEPQMVATKLMRWSWELSDEQRGGLTTRQFIRYHLMCLQLGENLTHFRYGNMPRRVASVEELLSVKPELRVSS